MKKDTRIKSIVIGLLFMIILSGFAGMARASNEVGGVKISEIMYNPSTEQGKDAYNEWVILHNTANFPIDVSGWTLGGDRLIGDFEHGNGTTVIPSHGFAIVTDLNTQVYEHFMVNSSFVRLQVDDEAITRYGLNNKGDTIVLKDSSGNVVNEVSYKPSWGGNGNGHTIVEKNGEWKESDKIGGGLWSPGKVEIENNIYSWSTESAKYHVPYYSIIFNVSGNGDIWDVYVIAKEQGEEWYNESTYVLINGNEETDYMSTKKYTFDKKELPYNKAYATDNGHWPQGWNTYAMVDPYKSYTIKVYAVNDQTNENYTGYFNVAPLNKDSDGDGLSDAEESKYYDKWYPGINPNNPDTDGDHYTDGQEIKYGTDPTTKYSHPGYVFMFYMDMDNNLGETLNLQKKIDEFKNINGIGEKAWVAALYDNYGNDNTYRYYIGMGYVNKSIGEVDMSEPETLVDFVKWTFDHYAGTHYVLVIYDHGDAWRGLLEDDYPGSGTAQWMSLSDLKEAMKEIKDIIGKPIDITVFHACLMSNLAVAYELRGTTDIIVASAETMIAESNSHVVWPYKDVISYSISHYNEKGFDDPHNLAKLLVDGKGFGVDIGFAHEFQAIGDHYGTMLAFDEKILTEYLFPAFRNLADILYNNFTEVKDIVKEGIENTGTEQHPHTIIPFYGRKATINGFQRVIMYFDLTSFMDYLIINCNDPQIINAAGEVNSYFYLGQIHALIINIPNRWQSTEEYTVQEMSIYILDNTGCFDERYKNTDLAKDTLWDEFLMKLSDYILREG